MRSLRKVLKDETGASLSIALLLFLVCTVVASVVLVAGTTASGRVAELATMDRKYYGVNSAVELFADQLKGEAKDSAKCLTVKETLTFTESEDSGTNKYTVTADDIAVDVDASPASDTLSSMLAKYFVYGTTKGPSTSTVAGAWTLNTAMEEDAWFTERVAWEFSPIRSNAVATVSNPLTLTLEPSSSSAQASTVTVAFSADGSATLMFQNEHEEGEVAYIVSATLVPTFDISTESSTIGTSETKVATMKWELADITSGGTV